MKLTIKFISFMAVFFIVASARNYSARAETVSMDLFYDGALHRYAAEAVYLNVNGAYVPELIMPPIIVDDYTLVPAREVFEPMNATVDWDGASSSVFIQHQNIQIILRINDRFATVNGQPVAMPVPAKIVNDKMMIPLRFVADSLNFLVFWDDRTRTAYIDDLGIIYNDTGYSATTFTPTLQADLTDSASSIVTNIKTSDSDEPVPARDLSSSIITAEDHPETSIIELVLPEFGNNRFTIRASSAISVVAPHLLSDNRMYIDIYNAAMFLSATSYPLPDNPSVASVRAAQNQIVPDMITRVVFDLRDGAEFNISISADRTEIYVGFMKNVILSAALYTEGASDLIEIVGQTTPSVSVYPSPDPNVLYIDIPYASVAETFDMRNLNGRFVRAMRLDRLDHESARITVELGESAMYDIRTDASSATVRLSGKTFHNIEYDMANKRLVIKKHADYPIVAANFVHADDYSSFRYIIYLGGDYSAYLGNGDHIIRDYYLNSLSLRTANGSTYIEFDEAGIFAYNVYEDDANIYIQPVHPKQKYKNIVILDPGHGGGDDGASAGGLLEKHVNLDISNRVAALFEHDGRIKAYATRTQDIYPELDERIEFGASLGDLYVSIHNNFAPTKSGGNTPNPEPSGTETYFYPHDFDQLTGLSGELAATILQRNVVRGFGSLDRGVKQTRYYILDMAKIPSVLVEVGFLSNPSDSAKLKSDDYKQRVAESIYNGIVEIFGIYTPFR